MVLSTRKPAGKAIVKEKPGLGAVLSTATVGFLSSSRQAHSAESSSTEASPYQRLKPSVDAFRKFLNTTGIDMEISGSLGIQLLPKLGVLSQIQNALNQRYDRRELSRVTSYRINDLPTAQEALKYMRYATAVYGREMIAAAQIGKPMEAAKKRAEDRTTRECISEHINVPGEDIVLLDVDYDHETNHNHLRHFVAVEHANRKVVLSIRGTFTLSEIVVDITAFSRPCFDGGEAHTEMYNMAERIWAAAGETLVRLLRENDGYELIMTGHSLGAGCASVLNMMCQRNERELIEGHRVRVFAFACPPLFTPLTLVPEAVYTTTNYILEQDIVPFLSVDSVRHMFHCVRAIEDYMQTEMTTGEKMNLMLARAKPPEGMIEAVHEVGARRLQPKEGAPVLSIPAAVNIWMKEQPCGEYDFEVCDPEVLSWIGLNVDIEYFQYHLPPRYEYALENLMDEI